MAKTLKELGEYKTRVQNALINSEKIRKLILGSTDKPTKVIKEFRKHVNSHLFIDDKIQETDTYIFFDIFMPMLRPQVKNVKILIYAICHRDILEDYTEDGYYGNRADILAELIEETLLDPTIVKEYGIGDLSLDSIDIYNASSFYGRIMAFSVPNFR